MCLAICTFFPKITSNSKDSEQSNDTCPLLVHIPGSVPGCLPSISMVVVIVKAQNYCKASYRSSV